MSIQIAQDPQKIKKQTRQTFIKAQDFSKKISERDVRLHRPTATRMATSFLGTFPWLGQGKVPGNEVAIIDDREGELHMHADDTTIYVAAANPDIVANVLNSVLRTLYLWCCHNSLTLHPRKAGYILLQRGSMIHWPFTRHYTR